MQKNQTLFDVTVNILDPAEATYLETEKPDVVLVHGDTSTAFVDRAGLLLSPDSRGTCGGGAAHLQPVFALPGGIQPAGGGSDCPVLLCAHGDRAGRIF